MIVDILQSSVSPVSEVRSHIKVMSVLKLFDATNCLNTRLLGDFCSVWRTANSDECCRKHCTGQRSKGKKKEKKKIGATQAATVARI